MAFYEINLAVLVLINAALYMRQIKAKAIPDADNDDNEMEEQVGESKHFDDHTTRKSSFMQTYLSVYLLAAAGDWLQGPHIYAIYRYDKMLPETTTAALYATGFIAGAISATFVGQLADKYGRKRACLVYCISYTLCCLTMLSSSLPVLYFGRICGGISTTLLYSVFETWMITEYHNRGLANAGLSTATIFGRQTTFNSVVAIMTGVVGDFLVSLTGTRKAPFLCAALLFILAGLWIIKTWTENYGETDTGVRRTSLGEITDAAKDMWHDKRIFALTAASAVFESMMYLFVFFWSAAIKSARSLAGIEAIPPFGLIFSSFMCAMMAGSLFFTQFSGRHDTTTTSHVLKIAMISASSALSLAVLNHREDLVFWAFCVVEVCVGLYFPSMNFLKGSIVEDGKRGKIYSLMRLPLNGFVVIAHSLAEEGDQHRNNVFVTFAGGLLIAFVVLHKFVE